MPFNGKKIAQLARARKIKAKDFKAAVFPDRTGNFSWDQMEKSKNPNAATIEAIANYLHCPIDDLFDRETTYSTNHVMGDNNTVGSNITISSDPHVLTATISHLHDTIERQDKTIDSQQKTIDDLNRRIDQLIELAKR